MEAVEFLSSSSFSSPSVSPPRTPLPPPHPPPLLLILFLLFFLLFLFFLLVILLFLTLLLFLLSQTETQFTVQFCFITLPLSPFRSFSSPPPSSPSFPSLIFTLRFFPQSLLLRSPPLVLCDGRSVSPPQCLCQSFLSFLFSKCFSSSEVTPSCSSAAVWTVWAPQEPDTESTAAPGASWRGAHKGSSRHTHTHTGGH